MLTPATVTVAVLLAATVAVTGCGSGCDAELHVDPVTIHGNGRPRVDADLSARITSDGNPVEGVKIEFFGIGPGGVILGIATSGPDGIAHLHAPAALGPDSAKGPHAAEWTSYRARVSVLQVSERAAATICADEADAPFRFEP